MRLSRRNAGTEQLVFNEVHYRRLEQIPGFVQNRWPQVGEQSFFFLENKGTTGFFSREELVSELEALLMGWRIKAGIASDDPQHSFASLIPDYAKSSGISTIMHSNLELRANGNFDLRELGFDYRTLSKQAAAQMVSTRDELFGHLRESGTVDLSQMRNAAYNAVGLLVPYNQAASHPRYTIIAAEDQVFTAALQNGAFDELANPLFFSTFAGTGMREHSWIEQIDKRKGDRLIAGPHNSIEYLTTIYSRSRRAYNDPAAMELVAGALFDPLADINKYYHEPFSERSVQDFVDNMRRSHTGEIVIIKANGTTTQTPSEINAEIQALQQLKAKGVHFFYLISTTNSKTDERAYNMANQRFFPHFMEEYMLVPQDSLQVEYRTSREVLPDGSVCLKPGFTTTDGHSTRDQYGDERAYIRPAKHFIGFHTYRMDPRTIKEIANNNDARIEGSLSGEAVALHNLPRL